MKLKFIILITLILLSIDNFSQYQILNEIDYSNFIDEPTKSINHLMKIDSNRFVVVSNSSSQTKVRVYDRDLKYLFDLLYVNDMESIIPKNTFFTNLFSKIEEPRNNFSNNTNVIINNINYKNQILLLLTDTSHTSNHNVEMLSSKKIVKYNLKFLLFDADNGKLLNQKIASNNLDIYQHFIYSENGQYSVSYNYYYGMLYLTLFDANTLSDSLISLPIASFSEYSNVSISNQGEIFVFNNNKTNSRVDGFRISNNHVDSLSVKYKNSEEYIDDMHVVKINDNLFHVFTFIEDDNPYSKFLKTSKIIFSMHSGIYNINDIYDFNLNRIDLSDFNFENLAASIVGSSSTFDKKEVRKIYKNNSTEIVTDFKDELHEVDAISKKTSFNDSDELYSSSKKIKSKFNGFRFIDAFMDKDSNTTILLENVKLKHRTRTNSINSYTMNSYTMNSYTKKSFTTTESYISSKDILIININKEGKNEWNKVIQSNYQVQSSSLITAKLIYYQDRDLVHLLIPQTFKFSNRLYHRTFNISDGSISNPQPFIDVKSYYSLPHLSTLLDNSTMIMLNFNGYNRSPFNTTYTLRKIKIQ